MPKPTKKQIEAMEKLGFSKEEIEDIIKTDEAIDKGEKVYFDLSPEKEKEAKKFAKSGGKDLPHCLNFLRSTGFKYSIIQYY